MDFFSFPTFDLMVSIVPLCSTQYIILLICNCISLIFPFNYVPLMNHFMEHKYNCKHWLCKFLLKISLYNMLSSKDCFSCLTRMLIIYFYRKPFSHNFFFFHQILSLFVWFLFYKDYIKLCVSASSITLTEGLDSLLSYILYYASKTDPEHLRDLSNRFQEHMELKCGGKAKEVKMACLEVTLHDGNSLENTDMMFTL